MDDDRRALATEEEVRAAIARLSDRDLLRCRQFGKALLFREVLGLDAEGLVHEAMARALEGTRKWPRAQPFDVFLNGAMRSIADEHLEKRQARPEDLDRARDDEDGRDGTMDGRASSELTPERRALWDRCEAELLAIFKGKKALAVLMGLIEGMSPEEICKMSGLTTKDYDSARKAIYRERRRMYAILGMKETP
jgi:RNA polymerase sigma-70 factor (ECF subfamily)